MKAFQDLANFRRMATGAGYSFDVPVFHRPCQSEGDFSKQVTQCYIFFHENLAADIKFLTEVYRSDPVRKCQRLIHNLRTSIQHAGNPRIYEQVRLWREAHQSPEEASRALYDLLKRAIEDLALAAQRVIQNNVASTRWREVVATDVAAILLAVTQDLGLTLPRGKLDYMKRQVEGRLKIEHSSLGHRDFVSELCAQEIVSQREPLPVSYSTVLDFLGLLGDISAEGAILVAHSVAAIDPSLVGEQFLSRVEDTWRSAANYRSRT